MNTMNGITKISYSSFLVLLACILGTNLQAQGPTISGKNNLVHNQQEFINLRFGMFIHFNIPTFMDQDWPDPDASPSIFNPAMLDCNQWARAAKSANMSYGCLTTKHHSGFCIWDTKTTGYNVMNSPLKRDIVKEYAAAFRAQGLKVMLYYSILDTHHKLRPGYINKKHIEMVKAQLTELLTKYGEITALIIDGWDAPWSRISYDAIPFEEIYRLVKSLQPNCLLMDLNAAKYPSEALFYTDIKSYEQGAGQHISKETNQLPALSCLPLNSSWFWKSSFPTTAVKSPAQLVHDNLIPFNKAYCNFILNVAPNRSGLLDDNAIRALEAIGKMWDNEGALAPLPIYDPPIISSNLAKHCPSNGSWSDDMWLFDFANDDDFHTAWRSNNTVKQPWYEVALEKNRTFNMITLAEAEPHIKKYRIEYRSNNVWRPLLASDNTKRIKIHRFTSVSGDRVRILIDAFDAPPSISELGVYAENP
jgi:alpha-L-fucosidase